MAASLICQFRDRAYDKQNVPQLTLPERKSSAAQQHQSKRPLTWREMGWPVATPPAIESNLNNPLIYLNNFSFLVSKSPQTENGNPGSFPSTELKAPSENCLTPI
jgi:hypothetical protein